MTTATKPGVTAFATPNDREVEFTRVLDAPRRLVFDAWTQPKHIQQWMLGLKAGPCRSARSIFGSAAPGATSGARPTAPRWQWAAPCAK